MLRAGIVAVGVVGLMANLGCRERSPEPRHNRNLGDRPGELMPVAVAPADARILENQEGVSEEDLGAPAEKGKPKKTKAKGDEAEPKPKERAPKAPPAAKKPAASPKVSALAELAKQIKKPAAKKPPAKATTKPGAGKGADAKAGPTTAESGSAKARDSRSIDSLSLKLSAPWKLWKPPVTQGLITAYTQKGVADVGAWSLEIPKDIKPEMINTEPGRFVLAAKMKQELKKHFKQIDKWEPLSKTTMIDGVASVEASCTLKKGKIADTQAMGKAFGFGIVGKTKGFLVACRIPKGGSMTAEAVREAVIDAIELK